MPEYMLPEENTVPAPCNLTDNPLLAEQNQLITMTPEQELEQKIDIINQIDSMATLTKEHLMVRRQRVELEIDNKKLDVARKTIDGIDKIIEAITNTEAIERVVKNISTPQDMKMMAEAAERMANTLKMLQNPNVMDDMGNKKHLKINRMFRNSDGSTRSSLSVHSDGDRMTIAQSDAHGQEIIQIDNSDD